MHLARFVCKSLQLSPAAGVATCQADHACIKLQIAAAFRRVSVSCAATEPVHVGWVGEGESFGEAALFSASKPRPVSIVAGDGGVLLARLDRAAYNRLQAQANAHQVGPVLLVWGQQVA